MREPRLHRDLLRFRRGRVAPPRVLAKVCVHNANAGLAIRFRGDMVYDIETYAGRREEVYKCLACGKTKNADQLLELLQAYMLLGGELLV